MLKAPYVYDPPYQTGSTWMSVNFSSDPILMMNERTVSMGKMAQALVLVVACLGLAACATSREPTYGERIQDEGSSLKAVGEQWSKGEELVENGEKRIEDGQKKIREGERLIEEGRDMVSEGTELMRDAKLSYEQWDRSPSLPPKN